MEITDLLLLLFLGLFVWGEGGGATGVIKLFQKDLHATLLVFSVTVNNKNKRAQNNNNNNNNKAWNNNNNI